MKPKPPPRPSRSNLSLEAPGWSELTRAALESLIHAGAGQGLPVVFDFDNTLVCGDIGEAVLAWVARTGKITPTTAPESVCPPFRAANGKLVHIESCRHIAAYYESLLYPTPHGQKDEQPWANAYAWATQVMQGFTVADVVAATRAAYTWSDPAAPGFIEVTSKGSAYPVPWFYQEMVELIAALSSNGFDIWIVSASNVWSVRWMVLEVLNPLLRSRGVRAGIRADRIVGISTLLLDRRHQLHKDAVLTRENQAYAVFDSKTVRGFKLTAQLQFPVPMYSGKIAILFDRLGRNPYLVAGDSPGDLPMMSLGRHRLWIERLNKPAYQKTAARWFNKTGGTWIVQPTSASRQPGFISEPSS